MKGCNSPLNQYLLGFKRIIRAKRIDLISRKSTYALNFAPTDFNFCQKLTELTVPSPGLISSEYLIAMLTPNVALVLLFCLLTNSRSFGIALGTLRKPTSFGPYPLLLSPLGSITALSMSDGDSSSPPAEEAEGKVKGDGALYDDMIPERKETMSNSMKERLRAEATSLGGDPNKKSAPVILYISAVIGVLVILGGKGILF